MFNARSKIKGQVTVEYAVMFMFIVAAIVVAGKAVMQPSVNRVFQSSQTILNSAVEKVENTFNS